MDIEALWKKTLDEIGLEVPPITFNSSFKKTKPTKYENGFLHITCPHKGSCMVLQNKYSDVILRVLKKYTNNEVRGTYFSTEKEDTAPVEKGSPLELISLESTVEEKLRIAHIYTSFSFESFAVSSSNQMAHAAAMVVSQDPGKTYNPLFLWGGVGVGKTHLLHAIGRKVVEAKGRRVFYCSAEDFTNALVDAIRTKNTTAFRKKYRDADVLLMDDVQFVAEREFIQEELFHTFNKLQAAGKQIVFTSDKPPKALKNIERRLVSRFLSGLVIDIQQPDFELKTAILLIKASNRGFSISVDTAKTISAHIEELRELEGFLLKLEALSRAGVELSKEAVERLLVQSNITENHQHSPKEIIKAVASEMGVKMKELKEDNRKKNIALARHTAMYLLKTMTNLTYEEIAALLGKKDHTTVMHAVQKIITSVAQDEPLRQHIEKIKLYFS